MPTAWLRHIPGKTTTLDKRTELPAFLADRTWKTLRDVRAAIASEVAK